MFKTCKLTNPGILLLIVMNCLAFLDYWCDGRIYGAEGDRPTGESVVLDAMKKELSRSMHDLVMDGYESPYFISYAINEIEETEIAGKFGSILYSGRNLERSAVVDVRVGDYSLDNTDVNVSPYDFGSSGRYGAAPPSVPVENDERAIRSVLWYLTDLKYKAALENLMKKRGRRVFEVVQDTVPDFSREIPHGYRDKPVSLNLDPEKWKNIVREVSGILGYNPLVLESLVKFSARKDRRYLVNSEGTEIVTESAYFTLSLTASTRAADGQRIENYRNYYGRTVEDLPSGEPLLKDTRSMLDELSMLKDADELEPYAGPALLDAQAVGVIFHEAIGHRLEGERQKMNDSQQTFKEKVGQAIIPEFLSLYDDPSLADWKGRPLFGHYEFDSEGIPAQRVALIRNGILENFLMSRSPIKEFRQSNGHGRSDGSPYSGSPMGRMGVTILEADQGVPYAGLKEKLLAECRRQEKAYGLIIRNVVGGETSTHSWGYQAFKETPILVYRVDVNTGVEELVRGVEIVGTPLTAITKILAASDSCEVFNGFCGAESGFIPVSIIAPAVVTQELELQKASGERSKPPILEPPFLK